MIVDLMLKRVRDQLKAQGMTLEITQAAKQHIIKQGYDASVRRPPAPAHDPEPDRGPARRAPPARRYNAGDTITVDADPDGKGLSIAATRGEDPVEA